VWAVQVKTGKSWKTTILPAQDRSLEVPATDDDAHFEKVVLTAVDRLGNASDPAEATTEEPAKE
jgi:hypothetical protein